jgi:NADH:ubiquinone oxidoreductase subunit 6 (subunit J)
MRIGASLFLIAVGAILKFAVSDAVDGVDLGMIGIILMIVGAVGLLITIVLMSTRRRTDVIHEGATYAPADPRYGAAPARGRTTYVEPADRDPRL